MGAGHQTTHIVIGLGEIGKPLFQLLSRAHPAYVGVDIEPVEVTGPVEMMHVCYPFVIDGGFVETTVGYVRKYHPRTVIVNSTVMPGTTRKIEEAAGVPCAYSPVRGKHTRMESDMQFYRKFVAGTDQGIVQAVCEHFEKAGVQARKMGSPEGLELAKLLETTYFGLLIAWAQEMDRFSKDLKASYADVAAFFEEIGYLPPYVFQPGFIGGHCVMPNIALLKQQFHSEFLDVIVHSNEKKAAEMGPDIAGPKSVRLEPIRIQRTKSQ